MAMGVWIRYIAIIEDVTTIKVLSVLVKFKRVIYPKQSHFTQRQVDEFWACS